MSQKIRLFNSVLIIYIFSLLNLILSVSLQLFLAFLFGTKKEMDVYIVVMNIPLIITSLILSFEAVFVPTFKDFHLKIGENGVKKLINTIFHLLAVILTLLSILGILLSAKISNILAPGFSLPQKELGRMLFCIMIPSIIFSGLTAFLTSVFYFQEKFAIPAMMPCVNTLTVVAATLLLNNKIGIYSLAWGVLLGSIAQFIIIFSALSLNKGYYFVANIKQAGLLKICQKLFYLSIGGICLGLILIYERLLASMLPEGSVSALGYAGRMISIVLVFPSFAIPTVLLPQLSAHYALRDINTMKDLLSKGIRMTLLCVIPLTVLLIMFASPLIKLLLHRGAFGVDAVNNTSIALIYYVGLIITLGLNKVITIGFLATRDVFTPSIMMIIGFLSYSCIAPFLTNLFSFRGLALTFSIASIVNLILETFILRKKLDGIDGRNLFRSSLKISCASLIMGIVAFFIFHIFPHSTLLGENLNLFIRLAAAILGGFLTFNLMGLFLRIEELHLLYETIYLRIKMPINRH